MLNRPTANQSTLTLPYRGVGGSATVLSLLLLAGCSGQSDTTNARPGSPPANAHTCEGATITPPSGVLIENGSFDVLVFTKTANVNCAHESTSAGVKAIQELGRNNDFSVTSTQDASVFTSEGLSKYEAVVFLNTGGDVLNNDQQNAFQDFIRSGKGFVGIHSAAETERDWHWYTSLVGAVSHGTPVVQNAKLTTTVDRRSTQHLQESWDVNEEWHSYRDVQGSIVPLLNLDEAGVNVAPKMGSYHPVSWYQYYDGGRSWFTGLGHNSATFADENFRKHLLGGIQWAQNKANTPATLAWTEKSPIPHHSGASKRSNGQYGQWESNGLAAEGKLFVFGGDVNTSDIAIYATVASFAYDPANDTWTPIKDMPEPITHAGQALDGRTVWIAGGFVGSQSELRTTSHVWKYDIASDTWTRGPDLPAPRAGGALVRLGRNLHFFGGVIRTGKSYSDDYSDHWVLNLDAQNPKWETRKAYPAGANHMSGVALNGKIYGVGGQRRDEEIGGNTARVYAYDPGSDTWTKDGEVTNMPRPLGHVAASTFVRGGRIVVVGGVTNGTVGKGGMDVANVIEYNPASNTWKELTPLPLPRQSPVAGVANGRLIVATGDHLQIPYANTWVSKD